jgi:hypothetical protein
MLLLALLLAQQVPAPMAVDEAPSALACTFEAALGGAKCIYEAASGPGAPRDNSQAAADAGVRACALEAPRDEGLRKDCEKAVAEASLGAKCALAVRLADERGRLTVQARGCVEAVRLAVAQTARAAAVSIDCCKCLGESRCAVSASQCRRELADLTPGAALGACLAKSCQNACAFVAPPVASSPPSPAEQDADKI